MELYLPTLQKLLPTDATIPFLEIYSADTLAWWRMCTRPDITAVRKNRSNMSLSSERRLVEEVMLLPAMDKRNEVPLRCHEGQSKLLGKMQEVEMCVVKCVWYTLLSVKKMS